MTATIEDIVFLKISWKIFSINYRFVLPLILVMIVDMLKNKTHEKSKVFSPFYRLILSNTITKLQVF